MLTQTTETTGTTVTAFLPLAKGISALSRLRAYSEAEGDDLIACCEWLGGPRWSMLAETLTMAALRSEPIGHWNRHVLESMHGLLSLERIDDHEDTEAGSFVCLDMNDLRIRACCRHTEALGDIVRQLRAEDVVAQEGKRRIPLRASAA